MSISHYYNFIRYKIETVLSGETVEIFCFRNGIPYNFFQKWHRDIQSPNQKIPDRKTKCVIKTHINIKQNVIFGAKLKPV